MKLQVLGNTDKGIKAIRALLLAFVLITLGFSLGKELTLRRLQAGASPGSAPQGEGDRVVVVYTHATVSCVTCQTMERLIHETLDERFSAALADGALHFQKVNFQQDKAFAQRHQVVANAVVVCLIQQGKEKDARRLDEIWNLYEDPEAFKRYVGDAVQSFMQRLAEPTS